MTSWGEAHDGRWWARTYYEDLVRPLLDERWPELPHAAGRLGPGSDVLGLDDTTSRDHDWGLRLSLFVDEGMVGPVTRHLADVLPSTFHGMPTRFAFTGHAVAEHHVEVQTVEGFLTERLGFDPRSDIVVGDWLSLTGQSALEVVGGPLFADSSGELTSARERLAWYPDDLWLHVLACDWARIAEELPLMGRSGDRGDELGSRVIAARIVDLVMHLAFTIERRWTPYAKWRGTLFAGLRCESALGPTLRSALDAGDWSQRQELLGKALEIALEEQQSTGLPGPARAAIPFWDRPYLHPDPAIATMLREEIRDVSVAALGAADGGAEQRTDSVLILTDPAARRRLVGASDSSDAPPFLAR